MRSMKTSLSSDLAVFGLPFDEIGVDASHSSLYTWRKIQRISRSHVSIDIHMSQFCAIDRSDLALLENYRSSNLALLAQVLSKINRYTNVSSLIYIITIIYLNYLFQFTDIRIAGNIEIVIPYSFQRSFGLETFHTFSTRYISNMY